MIEVYTGKEITRDKIKIIKSIAKKRYPLNIYRDYFKTITTFKGLGALHATDPYIETLVLGTNWFLCYSELESDVEIGEWVALNNGQKMLQVSEMMRFFKELLLKNRDKVFLADMRHDSSYQLFLRMLKKGFIYSNRDECIIDCSCPSEFLKKINQLKKYFNSIEEFLQSDLVDEYQEYLKYILHSVSFMVTDDFTKRYYVPVNNQKTLLMKHQ